MGKLKFNYLRISIVGIVTFAIFNILIIVIRQPKIDELLKMILMEIIAITLLSFCVYFYDRYKFGFYFSSKHFIVDYKNNIKIEWNDLEVDSRDFTFKQFNNSVIKLRSRNDSDATIKLELNWCNEQSLIQLSRGYIPEEHELFKVIQKYSKINNLNT